MLEEVDGPGEEGGRGGGGGGGDMSAKVAESASSRASIRDPPEKRLFARVSPA